MRTKDFEPWTRALSKPGKLIFQNEAEAVRVEAKRLREEEECAIVIGLGHVGFEEDKKLAADCDLDVIVGGHSHTLLWPSGKTDELHEKVWLHKTSFVQFFESFFVKNQIQPARKTLIKLRMNIRLLWRTRMVVWSLLSKPTGRENTSEFCTCISPLQTGNIF